LWLRTVGYDHTRDAIKNVSDPAGTAITDIGRQGGRLSFALIANDDRSFRLIADYKPQPPDSDRPSTMRRRKYAIQSFTRRWRRRAIRSSGAEQSLPEKYHDLQTILEFPAGGKIVSGRLGRCLATIS